MNLEDFTLPALRDRLNAGDLTPRELTRQCLERIEATDGTLHAFERTADDALRRAEELNLSEHEGPLAGIPVALKDNLCRKDVPITCSSRILDGFVPPYTATAVEALEDAGAIVIGHTNMDEFAMGSSTENSARGPTRNPHDPERVPGGSSGGSAAAVAAGQVPAALGSDTGGSVRQPAALCGIVGLKPTYGRVSRYGLVAFASSLDQIGPLARTAEGAAMLMEVIAGHDPADSTSLDEPVPPYSQRLRLPDELTVGIPDEYFGEGVHSEVQERIHQSLEALEASGASTVSVSLPHTEHAIPVYYILATAEASSNLARYDGVQYGRRTGNFEDLMDMYRRTRSEGFGDEVKRRIMLGTFVLSSGYYEAYYGQAQKVRTLIRRDFEEAFESCDLLLTPTSPTTAFPLGAKTEEPVEMYMSDICTISANLAGIPAVSVPTGTDSRDLPVGTQLMGPPLSEERLLGVAHFLQQHHPPPAIPRLTSAKET